MNCRPQILGHLASGRNVQAHRLSRESLPKRNLTAQRQARQRDKILTRTRSQGGKFLKTHPTENLEMALKALEIAEGSLEEVAEHYE